MRRVVALVLLLGSVLAAMPVHAQPDSLWRVWKDPHQPDSARLKAMQALAWRAVFERPDSGMALAEEQLALAVQVGDARARYEAHTTLAVGSSMKSDYAAALEHLQHCLGIAREMHDAKREANTYSNLSNVYRSLGDLPTALEQLQRSLRIDTELGNTEGLAGTYNNIGNVHTELHDLPNALANYEKSAALYEKLDLIKGRAQALMNLGATHLDMGARAQAQDEFLHSLALYRTMGRKLEMGMAFNNLGRTYGELGRSTEAFAALDSAKVLFTAVGSGKQLARNLYYRGTLLLQEGHAADARKACEEGLRTARDLGLDLQRKECSACLMDAYERLGDLAQAFRAQKEFMEVSDSLDQRNNAKEVLRLEMLRQFQQQQIADSLAAERARFAMELAYREQLGREQQRRNLLLGGGVVLVLLAGGLSPSPAGSPSRDPAVSIEYLSSRVHCVRPAGGMPLVPAIPFPPIDRMTLRALHPGERDIYFCTFTCWEWLPLIAETKLHDAVYKWMNGAITRGYAIVGYVIMPNHVHVLLQAPEGHRINTLLSNGKRFLAYAVVQRLEAAGNHALLARLAQAVRPGDRKRGQKHRVFTTSSDIQPCRDAATVHRMLAYVHANPVSGKWSLADDAVDYPHSSLAFYEREVQGMVPVTHVDRVLGGEV
ncbi:MAG: tetratricopeptide repeat protein [Flavobacteriales bacterium]|nr:tetratricopeptide repeat protein [Flavobacteriales bacterium]MCB9193091.1 tetratricopeptide repeat protein [Flavobacteriales bacterium]